MCPLWVCAFCSTWCLFVYVCKTWAYCFLGFLLLLLSFFVLFFVCFSTPQFLSVHGSLNNVLCYVMLCFSIFIFYFFTLCYVSEFVFLLSHFKIFFLVFFFFLSFFLLIFCASCSSSVYPCAIILSFLLSYSSIYIFRSWHARTWVLCPNRTIRMDS